MVCSSSTFAVKRLSRGADAGVAKMGAGEDASVWSGDSSTSESVSVVVLLLILLAESCGNIGVEGG